MSSNGYPVKPRFYGIAKCDAGFLATMIGWNGVTWQQAHVAAITYRVYDADTGAPTGSGTLVVGDTIFDTPQKDATWPWTDHGYNLRAILPASCFPQAGLYLIEMRFAAQGRISAEVWEYYAAQLLSDPTLCVGAAPVAVAIPALVGAGVYSA